MQTFVIIKRNAVARVLNAIIDRVWDVPTSNVIPQCCPPKDIDRPSSLKKSCLKTVSCNTVNLSHE
jgi:hypothetical protein